MKLKSMLFKDQLYYNLLRFIHLLKGSWVDSCFWLLQIELPWHHVQGWYTHMLSFLMGKCLGLEGVIWQVYVNLFKKLPNYFPKYLHHSRSEKAMAPHSSTLAWEIPWTEEPGRLQSMGPLRVRHNWVTSFHFSLSCIGEGNGNPLQCSCLENPRDRRAWWASVYEVAQSQTRLTRLSSSSSSSRSLPAICDNFSCSTHWSVFGMVMF